MAQVSPMAENTPSHFVVFTRLGVRALVLGHLQGWGAATTPACSGLRGPSSWSGKRYHSQKIRPRLVTVPR